MTAVFGIFSPQKTNRHSLRKSYPKNFGKNCRKDLNLNLNRKMKMKTEAKTSQTGQWSCRLKALTQHTKTEKSNTAVSTFPSIPLSNAEFLQLFYWFNRFKAGTQNNLFPMICQFKLIGNSFQNLFSIFKISKRQDNNILRRAVF